MTTMKAVRIRSFGGPEVLELLAADLVAPKPGQLDYRAAAAVPRGR